MATHCPSCSAALSGSTGTCAYCGTYVDLDLHAQHVSRVTTVSQRDCPHCEIPMQTVDMSQDNSLHVEHCETCHGLFFDNGELQQAMKQGVSNAAAGNHDLIKRIVRGRYQERPVKYINCPVCSEQMVRRNFGFRSGVVTDVCLKHGVWLDNGELRQLLEWKKAGGEELHQRRQELANARSTQTRRQSAAGAGRTTGLDDWRDDADYGALDGIFSRLIKFIS